MFSLLYRNHSSIWSNVMKYSLIFLLTLSLSSLTYALSFKVEDKPDLGSLKNFKASELCSVADNTKNYLQQNTDDSYAVHTGSQLITDESASGLTLAKVEKTLQFICQTYRADVKAKRQSRLHDKDFLTSSFVFIRWLPDKKSADAMALKSTNKIKTRMLTNIPNEAIFLTKYYTKLLDGSEVQTKYYNQALYALPYDEQAYSIEQAELNKSQLSRFKYTRQQVIAGALLDKKLAKPLIWLTEEALHDVLLQGTGVLKVDGETRYFNVHRNNDIDYDYNIGKREQARYWYFSEVPSIMGYGKSLESKIAIKSQVTFAGNVADLGLGKLIMVSFKQQTPQSDDAQTISRMGILADQGGAFTNNLFQLDLLVDSYLGWQDYHQANKHMADYAQAWIMVLKD
jgi:hypothetical protein